MGKVVYVTGAPATGKSTLCRTIASRSSNIENFCYSERLRDYVNQRLVVAIDEKGVRQSSANIIRAEDVNAVDLILEKAVDATHAGERYLLIDSHPVTKEDFGFRITPFSAASLSALCLDAIVCLYASPEILARRIKSDAQGRPLPSKLELAIHVQTQIAVAAQYSVLTGVPCFVVDSDVPCETLVATVSGLTGLPSD